MGSTYHSLSYHLVFATKYRRPLIDAAWRNRLHAYLGGCVKTFGAVPLAVGGVEDHIHILVVMRPSDRVCDLMREVKSRSSRWVHEEIGEAGFGWQDGYGAFSVSHYKVAVVRRYIERQEEHHRRKTSKDEYRSLLKRSGVAFEEKELE